MKPGIRVLRGPDWRLGDQDGGPGYLGTVVKIYPNNSVRVCWDIGTESNCRAGLDGAYDLRIYDNAQLGTRYPFCCDGKCSSDQRERNNNIYGLRWKCLVCKDTDFCTACYMSDNIGLRKVICDGQCLDTTDNNIYGVRWKCLECNDRDNCTPCYMQAAEDACLKHPFARYITPFSTVVQVPPRKKSKKIPLYGIFPGAEVTKVKTAVSEKENVGVVKEVIDLQPDAYRSAVKVEWIGVPPKKTEDGEPDWPIYRIGADGKVELKMITPASPGTVYIDHLPVLDLSMPVDIEYNVGDKVRVDLNFDTFKPLLSEYGGWVPELEKVLGEEGTIVEIKDENRKIVSVRYERLGITVRAMYMNVLTKISTISAGDIVRVIQDQNKMKKLQMGHGGWRVEDVSILGATGRILRIDDSTDAIVEVGGVNYVLNQSCLVLQKHQPDSLPLRPDDLRRSFKGSFRSMSSLPVPDVARKHVLTDISVGVGTRVVRGPDWSPDFENQDGGDGHVGSVVEICGVREDDMYPKQCVVVQWDNGEKNVYRAGYEKAYDLRIYDNAGIGVKHKVRCSGCEIDPVYGMLWECCECPDVHLCSECYFNDAHDINHQFTRYDTIDRENGTKVPKRSMSKALTAMGIFEKCKVRRGPDWRWHDQDGGGEGKYGEVIAVVNFSPDTDRDAAEVTWENGYTNVYRLGYRGRLDVVCIKPVSNGHYYRDHLPILSIPEHGLMEPPVADARAEIPDDEAAAAAAADDDTDARFKEGDKVRIEIDVDVLKMIEENRGAWNDHMTECIGKTGIVMLTKGIDITVDFDGAGKWTFHESVLNKVREFVPGEVVQVSDSVDNVRMLQKDRGGWNDLMIKVIGKKGTVNAIDEDGDVQVSFGDYNWTFNPECLSPSDGKPDIVKEGDEVPSERAPVERSKQPSTDEEKLEDLFEMILTGETENVNKAIQKDPQLLFLDLRGKLAVHLTSKSGHVEIIKAMFKCASKEALIEFVDQEDNNTPLLSAIHGGQIGMVKYLVSEGANKGAVNKSKQGAVQIALANKDKKMLMALRDLEFDVNQKDVLKQSPLFDAIIQEDDEIADIILDWPNLDVQLYDSIGFSPFFVACRKGNLKAVQKILSIRMMEIRERKEQDGFSGLHLAAFNGNVDVVRFLLRQQLVDVNLLTKDGRTPLHLACAEGFFDIVTTLVEAGSDIKCRDSTGKNCLHIYLEGAGAKTTEQQADFSRMVEYLIDQGVSVEEWDVNEKAPEDVVDKRMEKTYKDILERKSKGGRKPATSKEGDGPSSLPPKPMPRTLTPAKMSQSERSPGASAGPGMRIEDIDPSGRGPGQSETPYHKEQLQPKQDTPTKPDLQQDPELCESCEEEPFRYKMEPCGHYLCADCIPRKKQKKKTCAVCGDAIVELVEL